MNLTPEILRQVVMECVAAKANTTNHHPKTAGGSMAWFEGVRALRDLTVTRGWESRDVHNQGLIVEPKLGIVITIAGGDKGTGRESGAPSTRSKKGPKLKDAVQLNQLRLFKDERFEEGIRLVTVNDLGVLWLLLFHMDMKKREVRAELSRPVEYEKNRPTHFDKRIIVGPISMDDTPISFGRPSGPGPSTPEIIVEIKRRA